MNYVINRLSLITIYCLLGIIILLILNTSCEPIAPLRVENQTDQTLSIYVRWHEEAYYVGDVAPGEEIKNTNPRILHLGSFPIEAEDAQGNVVYSKTYTNLELRKELKWKVVIPPLEER